MSSALSQLICIQVTLHVWKTNENLSCLHRACTTFGLHLNWKQLQLTKLAFKKASRKFYWVKENWSVAQIFPIQPHKIMWPFLHECKTQSPEFICNKQRGGTNEKDEWRTTLPTDIIPPPWRPSQAFTNLCHIRAWWHHQPMPVQLCTFFTAHWCNSMCWNLMFRLLRSRGLILLHCKIE